MNERMDEYVRLFPVHPDYIGTFERLVFTEKRGALVTLRDQIQAILSEEVPDDRPGLIGYDKFWETVTSNSVLRADPNIGPVLKVSEVLSERVRKAFTRPAYRPKRGAGCRRRRTRGSGCSSLDFVLTRLRQICSSLAPQAERVYTFHIRLISLRAHGHRKHRRRSA